MPYASGPAGHRDPAGPVAGQVSWRARQLTGTSAAQAAGQPGDVGFRVRGLADHRCARSPDYAEDQLRVDGAGLQARVPVPARAELIPRVIAMHQVDPAGDGLDLVHHRGQVEPGRVRVARVQAEAHVAVVPGRVGDRLPQPGDAV